MEHEDNNLSDMETNSGGESGSDFSYLPKSDRKVAIDKTQFSIFELHRRNERGDVNLSPPYQRHTGIWSEQKKSRLIESVLLNIPIPIIYMAETENGIMEVVDGQQRLFTFFNFMEDGFKLKGLTVLPELNELNATGLSKEHKELHRKFEDYQLNIFLIKKESHPDIRFDVFQRINEGATELNAQELRNSIYRGNRINLLKNMAEDQNFKALIQGAIAIDRMKDQEAVLRFLAFYINGYPNYKGNLNAFLNQTLEELPKEEHNQHGELKKKFSITMQTINRVLGKDAFIKPGSKRRKINLSLFDVLSYSFAKFPITQIVNAKDSIKKNLQKLQSDENGDFHSAITANTLTRHNVTKRFDIWMDTMDRCIKGEL